MKFWIPTSLISSTALLVSLGFILARFRQHSHGSRQEEGSQTQTVIPEGDLLEKLQKLESANAKLQESNQALEQFACVAAHDLKAPIRSIGLWLQMLEKSFPETKSAEFERIQKYLSLNVQKSLHMIDELLEVAKVNNHTLGNTQEINLNEVVKNLITHLQSDIQSTQAKITTAPLPTLLGSSSQFESIFSNLIRNALVYRDPARNPEINIDCKKTGNGWLFRVRDNGIGIDHQYHNKIFQMFERLPNPSATPGTGIGLALCKKIVESWGGEICVESTQGLGSEFYFTYPNPKVAATFKQIA